MRSPCASACSSPRSRAPGPRSKSAAGSGSREREHLRQRPGEPRARISALDRGFVVAYLANKHTLRTEVIGSFVENLLHVVQPVAAARQRDPRLVAILARQPAHRRGADVRRIADDQVVARFELREKIRT